MIAYLRNTEANGTITQWVHGGANLADGLTKLGQHPMLREFLETHTWSLVTDCDKISGKKRQQQGLDKLSNRSIDVRNSEFFIMSMNLLRKNFPDFCLDSDPDDVDL